MAGSAMRRICLRAEFCSLFSLGQSGAGPEPGWCGSPATVIAWIFVGFSYWQVPFPVCGPSDLQRYQPTSQVAFSSSLLIHSLNSARHPLENRI